MDTVKIGSSLYIPLWLFQYMAVLIFAYFMYRVKTKSTFIIGNIMSAALPVVGVWEFKASRDYFLVSLEEVIQKHEIPRADFAQLHKEVFNIYAAALFCFVALFAAFLVWGVIRKKKSVYNHIWKWTIGAWCAMQVSSLVVGINMISKIFDFGSFAMREAFFISFLLGIPILICENIKRQKEGTQ